MLVTEYLPELLRRDSTVDVSVNSQLLGSTDVKNPAFPQNTTSDWPNPLNN
jgi:hypothetical protein